MRQGRARKSSLALGSLVKPPPRRSCASLTHVNLSPGGTQREPQGYAGLTSRDRALLILNVYSKITINCVSIIGSNSALKVYGVWSVLRAHGLSPGLCCARAARTARGSAYNWEFTIAPSRNRPPQGFIDIYDIC